MTNDYGQSQASTYQFEDAIPVRDRVGKRPGTVGPGGRSKKVKVNKNKIRIKQLEQSYLAAKAQYTI